jgi:uncharacterized protein YciI
MLFSVHALDKPGIEEKRRAIHAEHIAHVRSAKNYSVSITVGGPLVADDGTTSIGSLMVLEAPDRTAVEKFNRENPFFRNGIWGAVEIRRFDRKE